MASIETSPTVLGVASPQEVADFPIGLDEDDRSLLQPLHRRNRRMCCYGGCGILGVAVAATCLYVALTPRDQKPKSPQAEGAVQSQFAPLPSETDVLTRLAWGSCAKQDFPQPHWDTLADFSPHVLILAGDNVYGDCSSAECTELSAAYRALERKPSFMGARSRLPMISVWDDHDSGKNDGDATNPYKAIAKKLFLEFFKIPMHDPRHRHDGLYMDYVWGRAGKRIQVLLLDTRWFRSSFIDTDEPYARYKERYIPDHNTSKTMLGHEQWLWLREKLFEPADLRILVSSIQVVANGHGWECWGMLPQERARLYDLIFEAEKAAGGKVVLLSGDRHVGGMYMSHRGVLEATASSWTHTTPLGAFDDCDTSSECDEPGPDRLGALVRDNHFGSIEVNWSARTAMVALRRVSSAQGWESNAGQVLQSFVVNLTRASD